LTKDEKTNYKISDEEFLSFLRENCGLFSKTAEAISKHFGISYSRQAVFEKAKKFPQEIEDIREANLDIAEDGLHTLLLISPTIFVIAIKLLK